MNAAQPMSNRQRWTLFAAFWTLTAVSFAANLHWTKGTPWGQALLSSLADWWLFALISIPMLSLARLFPFERRGWGRTALLHLCAAGDRQCRGRPD